MHLRGVISHFYLSLVHSRFRAATYCILHARRPIIHSVWDTGSKELHSEECCVQQLEQELWKSLIPCVYLSLQIYEFSTIEDFCCGISKCNLACKNNWPVF